MPSVAVVAELEIGIGHIERVAIRTSGNRCGVAGEASRYRQLPRLVTDGLLFGSAGFGDGDGLNKDRVVSFDVRHGFCHWQVFLDALSANQGDLGEANQLQHQDLA